MRQSGSTDSKPETYQGNAKICRLVELYPCMYDRSHIHYMKKDVLDKAWDQIAKEAGEDGGPLHVTVASLQVCVRKCFLKKTSNIVVKIKFFFCKLYPRQLIGNIRVDRVLILLRIYILKLSFCCRGNHQSMKFHTIAVCKDHWRNIRTSFARSININKVPSSANRTKPYYLHKELQFLARHITPGIPVSRRSRRSEMIEVPMGEESFDGSAVTAAQEGEAVEEQESQQEHAPSSSLDEGTMSSKGGELMAQSHSPQETQADAKRQELPEQSSPLPLLQHQYIHQQPSQQQPEPASPPQQQPLLAEVPLPLYPFKKRLRTVVEPMMCVEVEQEPDVKPPIKELCTPDTDFDAVFLQGLLPEMKAMDFRQKIIFKKRIYEVIGDIFDSTPNNNATHGTSITNSNGTSPCNGYVPNHMNGYTVNDNGRAPTPATSPSTSSYISPLNTLNNASSAPTTVVNATDLALLRRLSSLLQSPTVASSSNAMTALPKNVASMSSAANRLTTASNAAPRMTNAYRGAITRSSANLLLNGPPSATPATSQAVKQELLDVAVCKSRWRNIRTSFARSININKVPSSANRTKPYYLHKELEFLARHITPGIPVSRRSRRSEKIEVSIGEESFDGLAATAAQDDEEYDEQCTDEEESQQEHASNSSLDEGTMSSKGGEQMAQHSHSPQETQADAKRQELPEQSSPLPLLQHQYVHQQPPQQQQLQPEPAPPLQHQPSPPPALPLESTTEGESGTVGEVSLPMYPFKKRLRTVVEPMMCVEVEQEPDVKPPSNELCTADSNFDAAFLQGLLPEMKAMDFRQKIIFKKRIYEVIGEIFESTPNTNATRRPSQPNPAYNGNASIGSSNGRTPSNGYATNHMNGSMVNNKRRSSIRTPTPATSPSASGYISPLNTLNNASPAPTTVVNATDLAMLRRLSSLLQSPTVTPSSSNSAMTALPKNAAGCTTSNTLTTASPLSPAATVSVHRGAMTRSSSNLFRTSMVNGMALPTSTVSGPSSATPATSQAVKQELLDE
ncbi:uncharacterized protein LOC128861910 [Anastrepha ludens]|uniref:uncharacterized protein LOC128861910 n=1 Tax=Anastrepha ludens TaxID=28586 RepID=UPI0023B13939|nr:uncharacterized protein LOC128861910 [Anastrepha ludens]